LPTQLILTDVVVNDSVPIEYSFTDTAFTGLNKVSDTFTGGMGASLVGNQIMLSSSFLPSGTFTAFFDIAPAAVPEPSSLALLLVSGLAGTGFLVRRRKR
jgi:hypothetical protein